MRLVLFSIPNSQYPVVFEFGEMCGGQTTSEIEFVFCAIHGAKQQLLQ